MSVSLTHPSMTTTLGRPAIRDTETIYKDPNLIQDDVLRLHKTLQPSTWTRPIPAVNRDPKRTILRKTGYEGSENRYLSGISRIPMARVKRPRAQNRMVLEMEIRGF